MPLKTRRTVLAAKVEVTEGTAETLTATEGILALEANYKPNPEFIRRNPYRSTLSNMTQVYGMESATITARVEGKGSGTAGTAPEISPLLRACGFGETIVGGTSVTYAPVSTADKSATVAIYRDGMKFGMAGCRGTFTLGGAVGENLIYNFTMTGGTPTTTDTAILAPTFQATVPIALKGLTFSIHGVTTVCRSFAIDMGVGIAPRKDFGATSGYVSFGLGSREPKVNFLVELPLVAGKDWFGAMRAGTEAAISLACTGAAGNRLTITAPKMQVVGLDLQDDAGTAMVSIDAVLNMNTGDDEISLAYT